MQNNPDILSGQLDEISELINNPADFRYKIKNIDYLVESPVLKRLINWFCFFNENFFNAPGIYSYSVLALVDAVKENQLFRTQTRIEFELSLKFYRIIISSSLFLSLRGTDSAKVLLNIALIYGKYPGMVVRPIKNAKEILEAGTNENQLKRLFEFLFVKYENPYFLSNNIKNLGSIEVDALMYVLQGNNIRNFNKLPFKISKKESFLLMSQLPKNLIFKENILERGIICSKLLLNYPDKKELLDTFLSCSKIFQFKVSTFHCDIEFWKKAYGLVCRIDWEQSRLSMQEYVDYFEFKKYTENPEYSLHRRTVNSITRAIDQWHEAANYGVLKERISATWSAKNDDKTIIKHNNEKYVFNEITSGQELFKESSEMRHCVFSYINHCIAGYTSIWSMKRKIKSTYKSYITIEVNDKKIIQLAGKRNRLVNRKDIEIISAWAEKMNFTFDYYKKSNDFTSEAV